MSIAYCVIQEVSEHQVTVKVDERVMTVPVDEETGGLVAAVIQDGIHIVAIDTEKEQLVFDVQLEEEKLPYLQGIE